MKQSATAVLERMSWFDASFCTEPYEAAWADEAIFFIKVHEMPESMRLVARIQISADGIDWMDEGAVTGTIDRAGSWFVKATRFGGWLRLCADVEGAGRLRVTVQLALKG